MPQPLLSLAAEGPAVEALLWTRWQRQRLALQGDASLFLGRWRKWLSSSEAVTSDLVLGLEKEDSTCRSAPGVLVSKLEGQNAVGR